VQRPAACALPDYNADLIAGTSVSNSHAAKHA
jgi:hypothetical protein